jgi:hypothetical protein
MAAARPRDVVLDGEESSAIGSSGGAVGDGRCAPALP